MRDLKHLAYFEELLREANNALVRQACAEGKLALAYNCSYIPEPLLDVEGCFGVRLRAPGAPCPRCGASEWLLGYPMGSKTGFVKEG